MGGDMSLFAKPHAATGGGAADLEPQLTQAQDKNDFFLLTIRALLWFVKEFSLDLTEIGAEKFKQRIDTLSTHFTSEERTKKLQRIFEESKEHINAYIKMEKSYLEDREKEFRNIIELLTNGIHTLSNEDHEFTTNLYKQSSRLVEITYRPGPQGQQ